MQVEQYYERHGVWCILPGIKLGSKPKWNKLADLVWSYVRLSLQILHCRERADHQDQTERDIVYNLCVREGEYTSIVGDPFGRPSQLGRFGVYTMHQLILEPGEYNLQLRCSTKDGPNDALWHMWHLQIRDAVSGELVRDIKEPVEFDFVSGCVVFANQVPDEAPVVNESDDDDIELVVPISDKTDSEYRPRCRSAQDTRASSMVTRAMARRDGARLRDSADVAAPDGQPESSRKPARLGARKLQTICSLANSEIEDII